MSHTIANLPRISAPTLRNLLLEPSASSATTSSPSTLNPSIAIIDVRDADYIGGHIRTATNVPSSTLDYRASELARQLAEKKTVVFHCMLSQQRGPGAALRYLRERERLGVQGEQEVYVLDGGFQKWQER